MKIKKRNNLAKLSYSKIRECLTFEKIIIMTNHNPTYVSLGKKEHIIRQEGHSGIYRP